MGQTTGSGKRYSGRRKLLFKIIAVSLPFVILLVAEISLRIFHYGENLDLFIEAAGRSDYLVLNPNASKRYFINQAAPTGNSELFKKIKEKSSKVENVNEIAYKIILSFQSQTNTLDKPGSKARSSNQGNRTWSQNLLN